MGGACSTYGEEKRCIRGFSGEPEEKRPLGTRRLKCENNIRMD